LGVRVVFQPLAGVGKAGGGRYRRMWRLPQGTCAGLDEKKPPERNPMAFQHLAGAAYRALTARKDGPSLYDVCDPVLLNPGSGDPHLCKFYRTALGNPALRPLLRRAGLAELRE